MVALVSWIWWTEIMSFTNFNSINFQVLKIKNKVLCTHARANEMCSVIGGGGDDVVKLFRHECVHTNIVWTDCQVLNCIIQIMKQLGLASNNPNLLYEPAASCTTHTHTHRPDPHAPETWTYGITWPHVSSTKSHNNNLTLFQSHFDHNILVNLSHRYPICTHKRHHQRSCYTLKNGLSFETWHFDLPVDGAIVPKHVADTSLIFI